MLPFKVTSIRNKVLWLLYFWAFKWIFFFVYRKNIHNMVKWGNEKQHMKFDLHRDHNLLNMYDGHWENQWESFFLSVQCMKQQNTIFFIHLRGRFSGGWDVAFTMANSRAKKVYMETCNFPLLTSVIIQTSKRVGKIWISPEKVDEIQCR